MNIVYNTILKKKLKLKLDGGDDQSLGVKKAGTGV
jgi:hypothetical protein